MMEVLWGMGLLVWSLVIHLGIWRVRIPRNHTLGLLLVFALAPLIFVTPGLLLSLPLPDSALSWVRISLLYVPFALAYIVIYSALEHESPTLALVAALDHAGDKGLSIETVRRNLETRDPLGFRLKRMEETGLLFREGRDYLLTVKGRVAAALFAFSEMVIGLPRGG